MLKTKFRSLFILLILMTLFFTGCGEDVKDNILDEKVNVTDDTAKDIDDATEDVTEDATEDVTEDATENLQENTQENNPEDLPKYTYTDFSKSLYTAASINVRNLPSIDGERIGGLEANKEVQITGQCNETGWYRINYNGGTGYVSSDYITDKLPSSWVAELDVAQRAGQIIVVTADNTETIHVTVSMHTKDENGVWVENYKTPGQIGRNGLGKEKEGDGKTPIGIFTFTKAFGILPNPGITSMPYLQVDETHHWVDDPESKYYNQCVSTRDVEPDWNSTEHLYKYVGDYNYSLSTSYNKECTPYVGCAIFLHCTVKDFRPTAGCIAIPEEYMAETMVNLRSDCIIIIDTTENIYNY